MRVSKKTTILNFFLITAFAVSVAQLFGVSRDYLNYSNFFSTVRALNFSFEIFHMTRFEPLFTFLSSVFVSLTESNLLVYALLVFFSLWIKSIAILQTTHSWRIIFIICLFYAARFFPLLEMTQIRAAISSSFLFFAFYFSLREQRKWSILMSFLSVGFHMSSVIVIPFVLFITPPRRLYVFFISMAFLITGFFLKDILIGILSSHFRVIALYASRGAAGFGEQVNPINSAVILDFAMIITALYFWNNSTVLMRQMVFLQIISLMIFWSFYNYGVFAHRWRELISVFWVFFFSHALVLKGNKKYIFLIFIVINIGFYHYLYFFSRHAIF